MIGGVVIKSKAPSCTIAAALLSGSLAALYVWKTRPWMATWGTEGDEASLPSVGDEHVPEPMVQATRTVTIDAPPEEIWPWLTSTHLTSGSFS